LPSLRQFGGALGVAFSVLLEKLFSAMLAEGLHALREDRKVSRQARSSRAARLRQGE